MRFTFHYVSISTDELLQTIAYTFIFTFHYVSISTLYYASTINDDHHLHSTMYLFQLLKKFLPDCQAIIYIPLCIYFNYFADKQQVFLFAIYIPLCIYFNRYNAMAIIMYIVFTFHYVSISTAEKAEDGKVELNLHSTMYLFQRLHPCIYQR